MAMMPIRETTNLEAAVQLLRSGQPAEAAAICAEVLTAEGPTAPVLALQGEAFAALGSFSDAQNSFEQALGCDPADTGSLIKLSGVLRLQGMLEESEARLKQGLEAQPTSLPLHLELGSFYFAQNRLSEAQAIFKDAIAAHPQDVTSHIALARTSLGLSDLGTADQILNHVFSHVGADPVIGPMRAQLARLSGDLGSALDLAETCLNAYPTSAESASEVALAKIGQNDVADAIAFLAQHEAQTPLPLAQSYLVLNALLRHGQFDFGRQYFMARIFPQTRESAEPEAQLAREMAVELLGGRADEELNSWVLEQAEQASASASFKIKLVKLHIVRSEFDQAVALANKLIHADPGFALPWAYLAEATLMLGDIETARQQASQALERDPELADAMMVLAEAANYANEPEDALHWADKAVGCAPANRAIIAARGLLKLRLGRFESGWRDFAERRDSDWQTAARPVEGDLAGSLEDCRDKEVFVWNEWGIGEQILFAPLAAELGLTAKHVSLECQPRLHKLLDQSFPAVEVRSSDAPDPQAEQKCLHTRSSNLGQWFRTSEASFPVHDGYLKCTDADLAAAEAELQKVTSPQSRRIGVCWASTGIEQDLKSLPPALMLNHLRHPHFNLINLQHGPARDLPHVLDQDVILVDQTAFPADGDMARFAALIARLDHVVTVSNTVAHIAGGLGRSTEVLVPRFRRGLWHWLDHRQDSPWYPSVRIHFFADVEEAETIIAGIQHGLVQAAEQEPKDGRLK